jgi:hypothetical protein
MSRTRDKLPRVVALQSIKLCLHSHEPRGVAKRCSGRGGKQRRHGSRSRADELVRGVPSGRAGDTCLSASDGASTSRRHAGRRSVTRGAARG